ncbi:MAG TPA: TrkA C-terminal domain-containing protein, partial [Methanomassiliicoccales archaeon]|nr:TrkA C-terminal domain-containing protein [Methanomassiliicoccales archaeon]
VRKADTWNKVQVMAQYERDSGHESDQVTRKSVREILTEMKDISELMVDLAYAAIMFDSNEIAGEVRNLERQMQRFNHEIRIKAMLSARTHDDAVKLAGLLQVASAAEAMSNAAVNIVNLTQCQTDKRPFLKFVLKEAEEKIGRLVMSEGSDMLNRAIAEMSVESETGMRIIALKRGKRWIYDPEGDLNLKSGDIMIVRGTEDGIEMLKSYASGERKWPVYPEEVE